MPKKGKKGVEQRVKGNVKAASSGRMAELLNLGGENAGFIGFGAVSGVEAESLDGASNGTGDEGLLGLSAGFQVVMKQLGKRDTTTKLKALQEFFSLCERQSPEAVSSVLTLWSLMYKKLSMDNDHRVREASHRGLQVCAEKVGRSLGPHLRSLIGCWVSGMSDPHASAASAAHASFLAAFPRPKQTEVYKFGFKAIVNHTSNMVLSETPDSFSDPKVVPMDERVRRYERALVMAVLGLAHTLGQLETDYLVGEGVQEIWQPFLVESRLWKLAKNLNPLIRSASFSLVVALCVHLPSFVSAHPRLLCPLVLGALGEADPLPMGPLWEAAILLLSAVECWYEHVNVQKALLPGLWSQLAAGGHGCARTVYPCLLPLLSKFMETVFMDDVKFASNFIERLRSGLHSDRARSSSSECEVIVNTLSECLLFLISHLHLRLVKTDLGEESSVEVYTENALRQVVDVVEECLTSLPAGEAEVVGRGMVRLVSSLLRMKEKNRRELTCMSHHLESFRHELCSRVSLNMTNMLNSGDQEKLCSRLGSFLSANLRPLQHTPLGSFVGERKAVNFSDEKGEHEQATPTTVVSSVLPTKEAAESQDSELTEFLQPVVISVCTQCLVRIQQSMATPPLALLNRLFQGYISGLFLVRLFQCLQSENGTEQIHDVLLHNLSNIDVPPSDRDGVKESVVLVNYLIGMVGRREEKEGLWVELLIECVLSVLHCGSLSQDMALSLLQDLTQRNEEIIFLMLMKLSEHCHKEDLTVILQQHSSKLLATIEDIHCRQKHLPYVWSFLDSAVTAAHHGSLLQTADCAVDVVRQLCRLVTGWISSSTVCEEGEEEVTCGHVLSILGRLDPSLAECSSEQVEQLILVLLRWCYQCCDSEESPSLLKPVSSCYRHLLSLLWSEELHSLVSTETVSHLCSAPSLYQVISRGLMHHHLHMTLDESRRNPLSTARHFLPAVAPYLTNHANEIGVESLSQFCRGSLLFTPPLLSTPTVTPTLPCSLRSILPPALALCDPSFLLDLCSPALHSLPLFIIQLLRDDWESQMENDRSKEGLGISGGGGDWMELVSSLAAAVDFTSPTSAGSRSHAESFFCAVCSAALQQFLSKASVQFPECITQLVGKMMERTVDGGELILILCLRRVLAMLESLSDPSYLRDSVSIVVKHSDCIPVQIVLAELTLSPWLRGEVEFIAARNMQDPCAVAACLSLTPGSEAVVDLATSLLGEVIVRHSAGDISFLEDVVESCQDPMTFSLLCIMSRLVELEKVPEQCWDFILCNVATLVQLLFDSYTSVSVPSVVLFSQGLQLCRSLHCLFSARPDKFLKQATEWLEFFLPAVQESLLPIFMKGEDSSIPEVSDSYPSFFLWFQVSQTIVALLTNPSQHSLSLEVLISLVVSRRRYPEQLAASVLATRCLSDVEVTVEDIASSETSKSNCVSVKSLQNTVKASLDQLKFDTLFLEEEGDDDGRAKDHHDTVAYLLLWKILMEIMKRCQIETRPVMTEWLKELGLLDHLLHGVLKLVLKKRTKQSSSVVEVTLTPQLEVLAYQVYLSVARQLPPMLRQWYLSLDRQTSSQVSTFTSKNVSPCLWQSEVESMQSSSMKIGNMEVRMCVGASEVAVVYRVDEFSIELTVCVPECYPLLAPTIREGKRARVEIGQWRKWLLQLSVFVANQNGSIVDGLTLWKSNLDKHFAGFEDCMICFSVIHGSNYSLPKMTCRTCKKKFHSSCLYKWFNTSAKSSCPLCRNVF